MRIALSLAVALVASVGCNRRTVEIPLSADNSGGRSSDARAIAHITNLEDPESVRYDPDQDVFFISNMLGYGSAKDGVGYIVVARADSPSVSRIFAEGGQNGVTLNAPKGMAIVGDTLWVADIDVLRGFDRHTGAPVGTVDFSAYQPTLLNDVAAGPNGVVRVSDTGIIMSDKGVLYAGGDRVFQMDARRRISVVDSGASLARPNGIAWDVTAGRWLLVNFAPFESSVRVHGGQALSRGLGKFDGVEALRDGRILYTSWSDSSLHVIANGHDTRLIRNLPMPADLGVDTRRDRVAVPLSGAGRVELWQLGRSGG